MLKTDRKMYPNINGMIRSNTPYTISILSFMLPLLYTITTLLYYIILSYTTLFYALLLDKHYKYSSSLFKMQTLHVDYTPNLITKRKQYVVTLFARRFYSPYIIIVWFLTAFGVSSCQAIQVYIPILTILSSIHIVYNKYIDWYKDLVIIVDNNVTLTSKNKIYFFVSETTIQTMTFVVSIWWIDNIRSCGPLQNETHHGLVFLTFVLTCFVLHVIQFLHMKDYSESIVRNAYSHV